MEVALGFVIALAIGLTGVGGGTLTAPVLIVFLGLPAPVAVGTALVFGAVVKLAAAPLYVARGRVHFPSLAPLLAGGLPGVVAGTLLLTRLGSLGTGNVVKVVVGAMVLVSAGMNLLRSREGKGEGIRRPRLLAAAALPIGLEVGFSSAGAGALGTLALLHFAAIEPAQVVGTDLIFGLAIAGVGGALHLGLGGVDAGMLARMLTGGIPGVLLGAYLVSVMPARKLRVGLAFWLACLGSQLLYRGLGG